MQPFNLPMKIVKLVLVNGVYIPPESWQTRELQDGDVLAIWPPVAGG
jgi:sulfur carrier protein ThiS